MATNKHGGARQGAGRKPLPPDKRKRAVIFYCPPADAEKLREFAAKLGIQGRVEG